MTRRVSVFVHAAVLAAAALLAAGCEVSPGFDGYVLFENDKGTGFVSATKQLEVWRFKNAAALPDEAFVLKKTSECSGVYAKGGKEQLLIDGGEVVGFGYDDGKVVALSGKCGAAKSRSNFTLATKRVALDLGQPTSSTKSTPGGGPLFKVTPNSCKSGGGAMAYVTVTGGGGMVHWLTEPGECFLKKYSTITFQPVNSASGTYHKQALPKTTE